MNCIYTLFRLFFLQVQHYGHQMDATFAYERGDFSEYADCQRRANQVESEIIAIRMERKERKRSANRAVFFACIASSSIAFWLPSPAESKPSANIRQDRHFTELRFTDCYVPCLEKAKQK